LGKKGALGKIRCTIVPFFFPTVGMCHDKSYVVVLVSE